MELTLDAQIKRQKLLFTLNLIAFATTISYIPFYYFVSNFYYIPFQIFTACCIALNFFFLKKNWLDLTAFWLTTVLIASILFASWVTPLVGTELLLIPIAIVLLPIFKKVWQASFMFVVILISYLAMEYFKLNTTGIVQYPELVAIIVYQSNIAVVFIVSFLIVFYFHKSNLKYGKQLAEASESLLNEKEKSHQLELNQKQLDIESQQLNEKVKLKLLQEVCKDIKGFNKSDNIEKSINSYALELNEKIASIQKAQLLQSDLETSNAGFDEKLAERFPSLSKAEKELCVFIKLKMSNREIAELRNTSPNTINVMKYRMKKKLEVETTQELDQLILSL